MKNTEKQIEKATYKGVRSWEDVYGYGCLGLVGAVIHQAIEDLDHHDDETRSSAIDFFYSERFEGWCDLLDANPDNIRKMASIEEYLHPGVLIAQHAQSSETDVPL